MIGQSDPIKICYYEYYPNSSIGNSTTAEEADAATFKSEHERNSQDKVTGSELPHSYDDADELFYQLDQTKICYYEFYPNSSTSNTAIRQPDAASLQSKHESNSQRTATGLSESSSSSPELSHSYDDVLCQSFSTKICYYECYPNSSSGNSIKEEDDTASLQSKHESESLIDVPQSYDDVVCHFDQINIRYYECYPNSSTGNSTTEGHDVASLQSKHDGESLRRASDGSKRVSSSPQFPQTATRKTSSSSSRSPPSSSSPISPPSSKPSLSALHHDSTNQQTKASYIQKGTSPLYMIPKDIEDLIKKDILPDVMMKPLSSSTYKDYFATLLYAEDFYIEKWSEFKLFNVTLELHEAAVYNKPSKNKHLKESDEKIDKTFVAFEIDSVPEKRPFLVSRDFVSARCLGNESKQFQGLIYRVVKSNIVLVEFEKEFYSQHHSKKKYDISFSFNRVCLKRAHHAVVVAAASAPLLQNYLFPDFASRKNISASAALNYRLDLLQNPSVRHILTLQGSPPYLVKGSLSVTGNQLSNTGMVVVEALLQIYQNSSKTRILICAPVNKTCDVLMGSLKKEIPESDMFRANAAFREIDGVPLDILPSCPYQGECFTCPSLEKLMQFRVIFSTFMSSYRLHNEGIKTGHFTHIFLVDASSATEPETMIPISNFADENTCVILTGDSNNRPSWVRSDMARMNGLSTSYFERLCENKTYKSLEPVFITKLKR